MKPDRSCRNLTRGKGPGFRFQVSGFSFQIGLAPLIILFAVVLAYSNSFSGVFLFDDFPGIVHNPGIRSLASAVSGTSRPASAVSFWLNYTLDDFRAAGYHLFNIVIHVLTAFTLYGVVGRTLNSTRLRTRYEGHAEFLALTTALIWGVHPLNTASVTYISQRAESLMGLFYLLTLYCAIRGATQWSLVNGQWKNRNHSPFTIHHSLSPSSLWYAGAVIACALGMGTKEVMVTAPVMVLIYDWIFLSSSLREIARRRLTLYAGLTATWIILAALMLIKQKCDTTNVYSWERIAPIEYLLTQFGVISHYIRLSFWPHPLCLDYRWSVTRTLVEVGPQTVLVVSLFICVLWMLRRRMAASFPGVWFFLILAPTSSFIPRPDCAFEHRMYLPLAGMIVVVVLAGYELLSKHSRQWAISALVAAITISLAFMTHLRNRDYYSEETMWRDVVETQPHNLRARNDLAVALCEAGKINDAMAEYNRILSLIPADVVAQMDSGSRRVNGPLVTHSYEYHYFRAHANMGLLMHKELNDNKEAIRHYTMALRVFPFHDDVREKLKCALREQGIPESDLAAEIKNTLESTDKD